MHIINLSTRENIQLDLYGYYWRKLLVRPKAKSITRAVSLLSSRHHTGEGGDPALPPLSPSSLMHSQLCQSRPPFCSRFLYLYFFVSPRSQILTAIITLFYPNGLLPTHHFTNAIHATKMYFLWQKLSVSILMPKIQSARNLSQTWHSSGLTQIGWSCP